MEALTRDIRLAARALRRSRAYTVVAAITLALGIGATTAIFTVVYAVLLKPLPFPHPDRLVQVSSRVERLGNRPSTMSPPDFTDMQRRSRSFGLLGAYYENDFTLSGEGSAPERMGGAMVTPEVLAAVGVTPALGRAFTADDAATGASLTVVISDRLWRTRFGGDAGIVGRDIRVDGRSYRVLGVMPRGYDFPDGSRLWEPLGFTAKDLTTQRGAHYLSVVGRLRRGATLAGAQSDLATIASRLERDYPRTNTGESVQVQDLRQALVGDFRGRLFILLAAVALVLLIACANVASLSLARTLDRRRELAVRSALGAGRGRLARELLVESLLLALCAGVVGAFIAVWGVDALVRLQSDHVPRLAGARVGALPLLFTLGLTALSGVLAGLFPAWRLSAADGLAERLAEGGRGRVGSHSGSRLRGGLVTVETGLAMLLLVGAGLLIRSFVNLERVDPGFSTTGLLSFGVSLPDSRYGQPEQAEAFVAQLLDRLRATRGVERAGGVTFVPLTGGRYYMSVERLDDGPAYDRPGDEKSVQVRIATPDYFRAMSMRMEQGRGFTPQDREGSPDVAVVNQAAARLLWPGKDALGHTLGIGTSFGLGRGQAGGTVVGVVADSHEWGPAEAPPPMLYLAHAQFPVGDMGIVLRDDGDPGRLIPAARSVLHDLDPELPMADVQTVGQLMHQSLAQSRFYSLMLMLFAATALLLAAVGIYGITAYAVSRRTREVGVRMALGAQPGEIVRLMLGRGLLLSLVGVGGGLVAALGLTRTLNGLLYGLQPTDPVTLLAVAALLTAVATAASWLPARRATRVDPVAALRHE
jgi:putative ABC transport system permease protein